MPRRADARDALCARDGLTLETLPEGARVGTGSPRRVAQLLSRRPDLQVVDLRGNVDTRLGRVVDGDLDAVVLAAAGLERLGRGDAITEYFSLSDAPTAPGQGALAIEVRAGDERGSGALAKALAVVNHVTTHAAVTAERDVLAGLEAGCAAPIGAHAQVDDGLFFLTATVYRPDGTEQLSSSHAATPDGMNARDLDVAAQDVAAAGRRRTPRRSVPPTSRRSGVRDERGVRIPIRIRVRFARPRPPSRSPAGVCSSRAAAPGVTLSRPTCAPRARRRSSRR